MLTESILGMSAAGVCLTALTFFLAIMLICHHLENPTMPKSGVVAGGLPVDELTPKETRIDAHRVTVVENGLDIESGDGLCIVTGGSVTAYRGTSAFVDIVTSYSGTGAFADIGGRSCISGSMLNSMRQQVQDCGGALHIGGYHDDQPGIYIGGPEGGISIRRCPTRSDPAPAELQ